MMTQILDSGLRRNDDISRFQVCVMGTFWLERRDTQLTTFD
jgi:hypothetical protein